MASAMTSEPSRTGKTSLSRKLRAEYKYPRGMKVKDIPTDTHHNIAESIIMLLTVHKVNHPECKDNCYAETIRDLEAEASEEAITKQT